MNARELDRFRAKITVNEVTGCWLWNPQMVGGVGYGMMIVGSLKDGSRRSALAHRLAYEHYIEPLSRGIEVHHICEVKHCVNPFHMRAVTRREHRRLHAKQLSPFCGRGHLLTPDTIYIRANGVRQCAVCARERSLEHKAKNRITCKHGHEFTPENTIHQSGRRYCRTCRDQQNSPRGLRTHCRRGHALTGENIRVLPRKGRNDEVLCLTCANMRARAYVDRKRGGEPNRRWRAYKRPPDGEGVEVAR